MKKSLGVNELRRLYLEFCESKGQAQEKQPKADADGFMNIPDGIDEELPFM